MTLDQRFWAKVEITPTCWLWTGATSRGHGQISNQGRILRAHHYVWGMLHGLPVTQLDHLCRVRNCVNPFHLEQVDGRTNILRGIGPSALNAVKTHCVHGHPFSGSNLRTIVRRSGSERVCRTCNRLASRRYAKRAER